jgi:hypothetical protein
MGAGTIIRFPESDESFIVEMVPPANLDDLSHAELKNLVVALFEQIAQLRRTIAAQAEEIA